MLRIAGTEVNIDHSAFEVYVTGCTRGCPGCHNPELQGFGGGMKWTHWYRQNQGKLKDLPLMNVWILGGDLLCQYDESDVVEFLKYLRRTVPEGTKLWLWTGGEFSEVPKSYLPLFDYIKSGPYREGLPHLMWDYDIKYPLLELASDNQMLHRKKKDGSYALCVCIKV